MNDAGNSSETENINVFLIDDHQLIREVIGRLIEKTAGLTFCGAAASAAEALDKLPLCQPKPDVALVDLSLGQTGRGFPAQLSEPAQRASSAPAARCEQRRGVLGSSAA